MSVRPRIRKNHLSLPQPTANSYELHLTETTNKRQKRGEVPRVVLGNGVILSQNPALPRLPGQVGLQGDRPVDFEDIDRAGEEYEMPVNLFTEAHVDIPDFLSPSKHRSKRLKQWQTWTTVVLPLAVLPYLELLRQTRSLRDDAPINLEGQQCECCLRSRKLTLWVVRFSSKF